MGNRHQSILMMVASFLPGAMGGAETQCCRLSKKLIDKNYDVSIVTKGDLNNFGIIEIEGIPVYCTFGFLYKIYLKIFRMLRWIKKFFLKKTQNQAMFEGLPYNPKDYGLKYNNVWLEGIEYFFFFIYSFFYLRKRKNEFNIIHVHAVPWISFIGALLGRIFKLPVIVKETTTAGLDKYDDFPFGSLMRNYCIKKCFFIAISQRIKKGFIEYGIPEERICFIPNGVEVPDKLPDKKRKNYTCLFAANLTQGAAKGLDVLLNAWQEVVTKFPTAQLNIAGGGDFTQYNGYLNKLGIQKNVLFMGKIPDLEELYCETQVLVIPSRREGLSNTLLEGMSFGVPIIATAISGNEDLIINNNNGILVQMDDVTAIAKSIIFYFENPEKAEKLGNCGYVTVKEKCGFEKIVEQYISLYKKLGKYEFSYKN